MARGLLHARLNDAGQFARSNILVDSPAVGKCLERSIKEDFMKLRSVLSFLAMSAVLVVAALCWSPSAALAQTGTGSITGTVRDAQEKVVVQASVKITNSETNVSSTTQTSDVGIYYFGALPRGPYTVVVEKEGFKKWEGTLVLQVGQNAVVDLALAVGSSSTTVEVKGAAPLITMESAEISNVKDSERIRQLPLNGREINLLLNLTPGVEGQGSCEDRSNPAPCTSFRVNGLKTGSLEITLDGISQVDRFGGGSVRVQPGLDTVQEFRIETVGSDARYSRPATVTLSTRSGTNEFHSSIFETHRNNTGGLRARRREQTDNPSKLIRNEFGASAGGPVYLPRLYNGHKKSFWFFAYEGTRQVGEQLDVNTLPTVALWNGDFSSAIDPDGNPITIYDPLTTDANGVRQPFPQNKIPANRIVSFAKQVQALSSLPTNSNNPFLDFNFIHFFPSKSNIDRYTARFDQHFGEKDTLSARWTRSRLHNVTDGGVFGDPISPAAGFGTRLQDVPVTSAAVTYSRALSRNFLNELLVGAERSANHQGTLADTTAWADKLGLPNPFGATGWPTFGTEGLGFNNGFGWDADNRNNQALTNEDVEDNVTWVKGRHAIQFGGKYRWEQNNVRELQQAQGSHDFNGNWTSLADPSDPTSALPFTGDGLADMLLGLPTFLSNQYNRGYFYFRQSEIGLYVSDTWKVFPRLTLNFGLRWDKWTPYQEKYNRLLNVDFDTVASTFQVITPGNQDIHSLRGIPPSVLASWAARGLTYATASSVRYPSSLFRGVNNNYGPRLGAAFEINHKTVLRGGYGEYFWTMPLSQLLQAARTNPPLNLRYTNGFQGPGPNGNGTQHNYTLINAPSPDNFLGRAIVDTQGTVFIDPTSAALFAAADGRNWKDGHARAWNVTVERVLPFQTALRLSYIGNHGGSLEQRFSLDDQEAVFNYVTRTHKAPPGARDQLRVNPNWNLRATNRTGFSNTDSGQVEVEHRFSRGMAFQWSYTYTRSLTTSDANGFDSGNADINNTSRGAKVPDNIQISGEPILSYDQRRRLVYYNSTEIPSHHIRYNAVSDLPFGRGKLIGKNASGVLNQIIGGWQIAAIGQWRGGNWLSVSASRFQFGDPRLSADKRLEMDIFGSHQRLWFLGDFNTSAATNVTGGDLNALIPPDINRRVVHMAGPDCGGKFTNRIAIQNVTLSGGSIGCFNAGITDLFNLGRRGGIIGPGSWNTDLSVFKNFKFKERASLRFTSDFFNVFNHPNDINPNSVTGLQDLGKQSNEPRIIQFSLRIDW
jgi:hypothetical protein